MPQDHPALTSLRCKSVRSRVKEGAAAPADAPPPRPSSCASNGPRPPQPPGPSWEGGGGPPPDTPPTAPPPPAPPGAPPPLAPVERKRGDEDNTQAEGNTGVASCAQASGSCNTTFAPTCFTPPCFIDCCLVRGYLVHERHVLCLQPPLLRRLLLLLQPNLGPRNIDHRQKHTNTGHEWDRPN